MSYFSSWKSRSQDWQRENNPKHPEYTGRKNGNGNGLIDDIIPPQIIDMHGQSGRFDCLSDMLSPRENRIKCKDTTSKLGIDIEYIGRPMPQLNYQGSKYGNPHKSTHNPKDANPVTGQPYTLNEAMDYYLDDIMTGTCPAGGHDVPKVDTIKRELKGKHLLCWCTQRGGVPHRDHNDGEYHEGSCHGDILSHIANHT